MSNKTSFAARIKLNLKSFYQEKEKVCSQYRKRSNNVKVIFATKYLGIEQFVMFLNIVKQIDVNEVWLGENRVQEAAKKIEYLKHNAPELQNQFKLSMVGNLQKNKVNKAITIFDEIHAVDSLDLAKVLDKRLKRVGKTIPIFLEVNISGEETKHGFSISGIDWAIFQIQQHSNLTVKGLMTMAPYSNSPEDSRLIFRRLRNLADKYNLLTSMGMSSDWKVAIEEQADVIRVGSRIFK